MRDLPTLRISCDDPVPGRGECQIELDGKDITPWVTKLVVTMAATEETEVQLGILVGQVTVDLPVAVALESELLDIRHATLDHQDG